MNSESNLKTADFAASELMEFTGALDNRIVGEVWNARGAKAGMNPVLLLHGGGQTRHSWEETAKRLTKRGYTAVTVDQRGHGDSGWVPLGKYSLQDFAEDARALSKALQKKFDAKPIAVGASLGGIASLIAEGIDQPGLFEALVFVDVTPRLNSSGVSKIVGFMNERVEAGFASLEEAADAIANYLPHRKRPKNLDGLSKNLKLGKDGRYRWHWDPNFAVHMKQFDNESEKLEQLLVKAASNLKLPVLLMRGSNSELVSEKHVTEFKKLVPHGEFVDISGAGHMVAGDRNDIFASALIDFLSGSEVWKK